jgi:hypothetical protein
MRAFVSTLVSLAMLTGICVQRAYTQDYRGRVQGTVADSTNAVIAGAVVVLRNNLTGVAATRTSGENGAYLFDLVEPGSYTLSAEQPGFSKFVQQNIVVQMRGDVTVTPVLTVGGLTESVTVSTAPSPLQFNTSSMDLVIDRRMVQELPILSRSPFALALLDPAVSNYATPNLILPFNKWQTAGWTIGGGDGGSNDLLLDGTPVQIGSSGTYVPPTDAVQEFTVQQNSVDAEFGHSTGGILSVIMQPGTNEVHGTAYYFGRNPALNAASNSVSHAKNTSRYHTYGGTVGGPIKKNKVFTFVAYEGLRSSESRNAVFTLPTSLERDGDFSQSVNAAGGLRMIYDPFSTQFDPVSGVATRTPFPGNKIPQIRMDPTALRILPDIWLPNNPGDDQTGVHNFRRGYKRYFHYGNISDRTDWNINDKWRGFGRFSLYNHDRDPENYAHSPATPINGYEVQSRNYTGEAIYMMNPTTVVRFRMSYASILDDLRASSTEIGSEGLAKIWPNQWYEAYTKDVPILFYPGLSFGGTSLGRTEAWSEHAHSYSYQFGVSTQYRAHYIKVGVESRRTSGMAYYPTLSHFNFSAETTADTFVSPDTSLSGDPYASFLLGAPTGDSTAHYTPRPEVSLTSYGAYFQDDWKISSRLTLNLGLRYEYQTPQREAQDRISHYLDLTNPIPEMQSNPPSFPSEVLALRSSPPVFNGAWVFADQSHRSVYSTAKDLFLPRLGLAFRLTNKTSLRFGYARFVKPIENIGPAVIGGNVLAGFDATSNTLSDLEGIPRASLSDPFPANNPLVLPIGRTYGRYMNLGDNAEWFKQNLRPPKNDRFDFSLQRQIPGDILLDVTYFMNLGHDYLYTLLPNLFDPNLYYEKKGLLDEGVPNPFFNYLTADKFPGPLRYQDTVSVGSLLSPYPQYGSLAQDATEGARQRYYSLKVKAQRNFSHGYSILAAYNYGYEKGEAFFNDIDEYRGLFSYLPSSRPRHRLIASSVCDLPFGKGRPFLGGLPSVLNAIVGGWTLSPVFSLSSGNFLQFGQAKASGAPKVFRNRDNWFDTSVFEAPDPYTPRTNPYQYAGVTGPRSWNIDAQLSKYFSIRERFRLQFRIEAYNLTNSFIPLDPSTDVYDYSFGRSTDQANMGREMQFSLKLHF